MLALAAAIAFQNTSLPPNSLVEYSGIPTVTGANIAIQSHTATLMIYKDHVDVSSLTLVKNNGPAGNAAISIPRAKAEKSDSWADLHFSAAWAGAPVMLALATAADSPDMVHGRTAGGLGAMKNLGTYALRINYSVPIGKCSLSHDQRLAVYDLSSPVSIGTVMVSYKYAQDKTFDEPKCAPDLGWQTGEHGGFVRLNNYDGKAGLTYAAFYSGWFNTGGG